MKPFNLEAAKAGAPVVTRSGEAVRHLCFDILSYHGWTVGGLVKENGYEIFSTWKVDGSYVANSSEHPLDLVMAPVKKDGWVNLYRNRNGGVYPGRGVYSSETAAKDAALACSTPVLATVRVEWEE